MSKNIDFEIGTVVTDEFLDGVQELLTGTVQNARLAPGTASDRVSLALSGDTVFDKRGSVNIEGKYCFFDVSKDSSPASSGDGTKSIFLSTTDNGATKQPNFNVTVDTAPPASSYIKKIGLVDKSGSTLSNVRMITGVQADHEQYNHFTFRSALNIAGEVVLEVEGQSNQTSSFGAVYDSDLSTNPTKALSIGVSGNEHFYVDTAGRVVFNDNGSGNGDVGLQSTNHGVKTVLTVNKEFSSHIAGAGSESFSARVMDPITSDIYNRITVYNDGEISWGSGALAADVFLSRSGVGELSLGTGNTLLMDYTITSGDSPDIVTNKEYVDGAVGSLTSSSKRFSFFIGS